MNQRRTTIQLHAPYLIFLADARDHVTAKTGLGLAQWCPERCRGQLRLPGATADAGLAEMSIETAVSHGVRTLILGVAPAGGSIGELWIGTLRQAARAGLDIAAGMHGRLGSLPGLAAAAAAGGSKLIDVRVPPPGLPVGDGRKRSGMRLLTVGTDCAIGKKYTALALARELQKRGIKATFRATGQTGIMIAGEGIPIDAVVSDFVAGAAETLSPDNEADHWDIVEGQGSLFHPSYAGVSLGLLHGSQPDAIVVCHEANRPHVDGLPAYPLPDIVECIETHLAIARRTNPRVRCVGVSVNSTRLAADRRQAWLGDISRRTGLPCVDPLVEGPSAIVDELLKTASRAP